MHTDVPHVSNSQRSQQRTAAREVAEMHSASYDPHPSTTIAISSSGASGGGGEGGGRIGGGGGLGGGGEGGLGGGEGGGDEHDVDDQTHRPSWPHPEPQHEPQSTSSSSPHSRIPRASHSRLAS